MKEKKRRLSGALLTMDKNNLKLILNLCNT
ncbi:hypothetical protein SAMN05444369_107110 [Capnocytophaga haemolytica]|uniref:Uncharacterized protein n=1 Tax=Capnocytophaga haemolytica TaxID=45243 RepID=A0AAX2H205_9FLAO|nr:hypothetical protein SAMN05444369_107110 [Capnocytophaga haemolytica]SNV15530.1 Uncharacterised protein [Capnocytophaga haemolytica]